MMNEAPALENIPKGLCSFSKELRMYCSVRQYLNNEAIIIVNMIICFPVLKVLRFNVI